MISEHVTGIHDKGITGQEPDQEPAANPAVAVSGGGVTGVVVAPAPADAGVSDGVLKIGTDKEVVGVGVTGIHVRLMTGGGDGVTEHVAIAGSQISFKDTVNGIIFIVCPAVSAFAERISVVEETEFPFLFLTFDVPVECFSRGGIDGGKVAVIGDKSRFSVVIFGQNGDQRHVAFSGKEFRRAAAEIK